jgi:hypothetical protein
MGGWSGRRDLNPRPLGPQPWGRGCRIGAEFSRQSRSRQKPLDPVVQLAGRPCGGAGGPWRSWVRGDSCWPLVTPPRVSHQFMTTTGGQWSVGRRCETGGPRRPCIDKRSPIAPTGRDGWISAKCAHLAGRGGPLGQQYTASKFSSTFVLSGIDSCAERHFACYDPIRHRAGLTCPGRWRLSQVLQVESAMRWRRNVSATA